MRPQFKLASSRNKYEISMKRLQIYVITLCLLLVFITCLPSPQIAEAQSNVLSSSFASYGTISYAAPTSTPTPAPTSGLSPLHVDGNKIKDASGNTVILHGVDWESGYWWSGNPAEQMPLIKAMGCNIVGVCHHWYSFTSPTSYDSDLSKMDELVSAATNNGLYVYLRCFSMAAVSMSERGFTWSQWVTKLGEVSNRYSAYTNIIYEPISECAELSNADYSSCITQAIDAIRTHSPNAIVSICDLGSPGTFNFMSTNPVVRSNIAFTSDPYGFSTSPTNSESGIWSSLSARNSNIAGSYPMFFGEFGPYRNINEYVQWEIDWLNNFMATMDSHGLSGYMAWTWHTGGAGNCCLIDDWHGTLSAYGQDVSDYYKSASPSTPPTT